MKDTKNDLLIVGGTIVAFTALGFVIGFILGNTKKKQLVVTPAGNLEKIEVD